MHNMPKRHVDIVSFNSSLDWYVCTSHMNYIAVCGLRQAHAWLLSGDQLARQQAAVLAV